MTNITGLDQWLTQAPEDSSDYYDEVYEALSNDFWNRYGVDWVLDSDTIGDWIERSLDRDRPPKQTASIIERGYKAFEI